MPSEAESWMVLDSGGTVYYYNSETKENTWEKPAVLEGMELHPVRAPTSAEAQASGHPAYDDGSSDTDDPNEEYDIEPGHGDGHWNDDATHLERQLGGRRTTVGGNTELMSDIMFEKADRNGHGLITPQELMRLLASLEIGLTSDEVHHLFDPEGEGGPDTMMDKRQFHSWYRLSNRWEAALGIGEKEMPMRKQIGELWNEFDDGTGVLDMEDFELVHFTLKLSQMSELSKEELQEAMAPHGIPLTFSVFCDWFLAEGIICSRVKKHTNAIGAEEVESVEARLLREKLQRERLARLAKARLLAKYCVIRYLGAVLPWLKEKVTIKKCTKLHDPISSAKDYLCSRYGVSLLLVTFLFWGMAAGIWAVRDMRYVEISEQYSRRRCLACFNSAVESPTVLHEFLACEVKFGWNTSVAGSFEATDAAKADQTLGSEDDNILGQGSFFEITSAVDGMYTLGPQAIMGYLIGVPLCLYALIIAWACQRKSGRTRPPWFEEACWYLGLLYMPGTVYLTNKTFLLYFRGDCWVSAVPSFLYNVLFKAMFTGTFLVIALVVIAGVRFAIAAACKSDSAIFGLLVNTFALFFVLALYIITGINLVVAGFVLSQGDALCIPFYALGLLGTCWCSPFFRSANKR